MKTEEEVRLRRLEVLNTIKDMRNNKEKMKAEFNFEYASNRIWDRIMTVSFEMLNWVLGEGSGSILNKIMSIEKDLGRALSGGQPPQQNLDSVTIIKEIEELKEQIAQDYEELLLQDLDELE